MKRDLIGRFLLDGIDYTDPRPGLMAVCIVACGALALWVGS